LQKTLSKRSEFTKNVLTLLSGTSIAQIIPIIISPILTRIYTPEDFGLFALYNSIILIFATFIGGKFELAILLPEKKEDALNITILSILLALIISFITLWGTFIFHKQIASLSNLKDFSNILYIIPFSILSSGLFQSFNYWNNREKNFKRLAKIKIIQSGTTSTTNVCFGLTGFNNFGLILGSFTGQCIATFILGHKFLKSIKSLTDKITHTRIISLGKRYINFPKYEIASSFFNTSSNQAPILLLTTFFNNTITGYFSLSQRILTLPMNLLGTSVSQVFFHEASLCKKENRKLNSLTISTIKKLFYLSFIPMTIIGVFGDYIFQFIFGKNWVIAGNYARILAPWILIVFIISPVSSLLFILEKQKVSLFFNATLLITRVLSLFVGFYLLHNIYQIIALFSLLSIFIWIILMLFLFQLINIKLKKIAKLFYYFIITYAIMFSIRLFFIGRLF